MKAQEGQENNVGNAKRTWGSAVHLYETMSIIFHRSSIEKSESVPVMLKGDAVSYYSKVSSPGEPYERVVKNV